MYSLVLSSLALSRRINDHGIINERFVDSLPYIICIVDAIGFLWCLLTVLAGHAKILGTRNIGADQGNEYLFLAVSTVGPIISFVIHIPYITIAYLNDGTYATSILIFYLITIFVVFGSLNSTYDTYMSGIIAQRIEENTENVDRNLYGVKLVCVPLVIAVPILFLAGVIAAMLMIVPITKAFSDAPSRLQTFYQTAAVVVGVYLVYWKFYTNKPSIESVIGERQGCLQNQANLQFIPWDTLSKEERVKQFYAKFADIVMNYYIPDSTKNNVANQLLQEAHNQLQIANQMLQEANQRLQATRVQLLQARKQNPDNQTIIKLSGANDHLCQANQHLLTANQRLQEVIMLQTIDQYEELEEIKRQLLRASDMQKEAANQQLHAVNRLRWVANLGQVQVTDEQLNEHRSAANNQRMKADNQLQSAKNMVHLQVENNWPQDHGLMKASSELHDTNEELRRANEQLARVELQGGGGEAVAAAAVQRGRRRGGRGGGRGRYIQLQNLSDHP